MAILFPFGGFMLLIDADDVLFVFIEYKGIPSFLSQEYLSDGRYWGDHENTGIPYF